MQKEIVNTQFVACMNPTAGSFFITPRMQRHFATFAVHVPSPDIIRSIYTQLVEGHLSGGFDEDVRHLDMTAFRSTNDASGCTDVHASYVISIHGAFSKLTVVIQVVRLGTKLVDAMIELHSLAANAFLPSAGLFFCFCFLKVQKYVLGGTQLAELLR